MTPSQIEARRRLELAQAYVQSAEEALERARASLSAVRYAAPEYDAIGRAAQILQKLRLRLRRRVETGRFDLDHTPDDGIPPPNNLLKLKKQE